MEILRNIEVEKPSEKSIYCDVFFNMDKANKPVVLFNHGFKGFKDWGNWDQVAENFANAGYVFIKFNQSRGGINFPDMQDLADLEAFSTNTIGSELNNMEQMIQWISSNNMLPLDLIDDSKIHLMGHSRGGASVLVAASKSPQVKSVICWAAVSDWDSHFQKLNIEKWKEDGISYVLNSRTNQELPLKYEIYEEYKSHRDDYSIEGATKSLDIPIFLVHGTEDETVLFNQALSIKGWGKNVELYLIPNANHVFGAKHPWDKNELPNQLKKVVDITIDFISRQAALQLEFIFN